MPTRSVRGTSAAARRSGAGSSAVSFGIALLLLILALTSSPFASFAAAAAAAKPDLSSLPPFVGCFKSGKRPDGGLIYDLLGHGEGCLPHLPSATAATPSPQPSADDSDSTTNGRPVPMPSTHRNSAPAAMSVKPTDSSHQAKKRSSSFSAQALNRPAAGTPLKWAMPIEISTPFEAGYIYSGLLAAFQQHNSGARPAPNVDYDVDVEPLMHSVFSYIPEPFLAAFIFNGDTEYFGFAGSRLLSDYFLGAFGEALHPPLPSVGNQPLDFPIAFINTQVSLRGSASAELNQLVNFAFHSNAALCTRAAVFSLGVGAAVAATFLAQTGLPPPIEVVRDHLTGDIDFMGLMKVVMDPTVNCIFIQDIEAVVYGIVTGLEMMVSADRFEAMRFFIGSGGIKARYDSPSDRRTFRNLFGAQVAPDPADTRLPLAEQFRDAMADPMVRTLTETRLAPTPAIQAAIDAGNASNVVPTSFEPNFASFEGYIIGRYILEILASTGDVTRTNFIDSVYRTRFGLFGGYSVGPFTRGDCAVGADFECNCNVGLKRIVVSRVNGLTGAHEIQTDNVDRGEVGVSTLAIPLEVCSDVKAILRRALRLVVVVPTSFAAAVALGHMRPSPQQSAVEFRPEAYERYLETLFAIVNASNQRAAGVLGGSSSPTDSSSSSSSSSAAGRQLSAMQVVPVYYDGSEDIETALLPRLFNNYYPYAVVGVPFRPSSSSSSSSSTATDRIARLSPRLLSLTAEDASHHPSDVDLFSSLAEHIHALAAFAASSSASLLLTTTNNNINNNSNSGSNGLSGPFSARPLHVIATSELLSDLCLRSVHTFQHQPATIRRIDPAALLSASPTQLSAAVETALLRALGVSRLLTAAEVARIEAEVELAAADGRDPMANPTSAFATFVNGLPTASAISAAASGSGASLLPPPIVLFASHSPETTAALMALVPRLPRRTLLLVAADEGHVTDGFVADPLTAVTSSEVLFASGFGAWWAGGGFSSLSQSSYAVLRSNASFISNKTVVPRSQSEQQGHPQQQRRLLGSLLRPLAIVESLFSVAARATNATRSFPETLYAAATFSVDAMASQSFGPFSNAACDASSSSSGGSSVAGGADAARTRDPSRRCDCAKGARRVHVLSLRDWSSSVEAGSPTTRQFAFDLSGCAVAYAPLIIPDAAAKEALSPAMVAVVAVFSALGVVLLGIGAAVLILSLLRDPRRSHVFAPKDPSVPFSIVFTDIQSSTMLWAHAPAAMSAAVDAHNSLMRGAIGRHKGYEVKTIGDSFMVAFKSASDAVRFAVDAQRSLFEHEWDPAIDGAYVEMERILIENNMALLYGNNGGNLNNDEYFNNSPYFSKGGGEAESGVGGGGVRSVSYANTAHTTNDASVVQQQVGDRGDGGGGEGIRRIRSLVSLHTSVAGGGLALGQSAGVLPPSGNNNLHTSVSGGGAAVTVVSAGATPANTFLVPAGAAASEMSTPHLGPSQGQDQQQQPATHNNAPPNGSFSASEAAFNMTTTSLPAAAGTYSQIQNQHNSNPNNNNGNSGQSLPFTPATDTAAWNGLRVRIGVHFGLGECRLDPVANAYDYYGTLVNCAARVEGIGHGGMVLATRAVIEALAEDPKVPAPPTAAGWRYRQSEETAGAIGVGGVGGIQQQQQQLPMFGGPIATTATNNGMAKRVASMAATEAPPTLFDKTLDGAAVGGSGGSKTRDSEAHVIVGRTTIDSNADGFNNGNGGGNIGSAIVTFNAAATTETAPSSPTGHGGAATAVEMTTINTAASTAQQTNNNNPTNLPFPDHAAAFSPRSLAGAGASRTSNNHNGIVTIVDPLYSAAVEKATTGGGGGAAAVDGPQQQQQQQVFPEHPSDAPAAAFLATAAFRATHHSVGPQPLRGLGNVEIVHIVLTEFAFRRYPPLRLDRDEGLDNEDAAGGGEGGTDDNASIDSYVMGSCSSDATQLGGGGSSGVIKLPRKQLKADGIQSVMGGAGVISIRPPSDATTVGGGGASGGAGGTSSSNINGNTHVLSTSNPNTVNANAAAHEQHSRNMNKVNGAAYGYGGALTGTHQAANEVERYAEKTARAARLTDLADFMAQFRMARSLFSQVPARQLRDLLELIAKKWHVPLPKLAKMKRIKCAPERIDNYILAHTVTKLSKTLSAAAGQQSAAAALRMQQQRNNNTNTNQRGGGGQNARGAGVAGGGGGGAYLLGGGAMALSPFLGAQPQRRGSAASAVEQMVQHANYQQSVHRNNASSSNVGVSSSAAGDAVAALLSSGSVNRRVSASPLPAVGAASNNNNVVDGLRRGSHHSQSGMLSSSSQGAVRYQQQQQLQYHHPQHMASLGGGGPLTSDGSNGLILLHSARSGGVGGAVTAFSHASPSTSSRGFSPVPASGGAAPPPRPTAPNAEAAAVAAPKSFASATAGVGGGLAIPLSAPPPTAEAQHPFSPVGSD